MFDFIEPVETVLQRLQKNGFEAYLVGGCVRDFLMGNQPKDYDITTNAKPNEMKRVFSDCRIRDTGIQHGTITIWMNEEPFELTTYRVEGSYSDARHPDAVCFSSSLAEDAARRDFTMNAIAYHPQEGILDFYDGCQDIERQRIRCVGNPELRFEEDALRILRALRFSSVLGFQIDKKTETAIFRHKHLLNCISKERIATELKKLLCGRNVKQVLLEYVDVLGVVLPELLPMKGFPDVPYKHDVLTHTAQALEQIAPIPRLRLAVLFHGAGKPHCFSWEKAAYLCRHEKRSAQLAEEALRRLKWDRFTWVRVAALIQSQNLSTEENKQAVRKRLSFLTPAVFFDLLQVQSAIYVLEGRVQDKHFKSLQQLANEIIREGSCYSRKNLAVNGSDLKKLGYQGVEIGNMLSYLLKSVLHEKVSNEKDALLCYAEAVAENHPR